MHLFVHTKITKDTSGMTTQITIALSKLKGDTEPADNPRNYRNLLLNQK